MNLESKSQKIADACTYNDVDELIKLATSEVGLVNDELRCSAWRILLGCHINAPRCESAWEGLAIHQDEDQVKLDVNRAFVYYPKGESEQQIQSRKGDLEGLIIEVLRRHPSLCYFQGFHDIAQVFLLVLGRERAVPLVRRLCLLRIRDFMLPSLSAAIVHLRLLPPILRSVDPKLERHLSQTQPFFALAATLTLYAHDIQEYGDIARLFDFILAQPAVMPVYLFASIILSRKAELLDIEPDEPEMLHSVLSKLPKPLDLEGLLSRALQLHRKSPPESLSGGVWRRVSAYSVLKTTDNVSKLMTTTLEDGERYFVKQNRQMQIAQTVEYSRKLLWRYRRPAGALGVALLATIVSWWFRHDGYGMATMFWRRVVDRMD